MNAPWEFQFLGRLSARRGDQVITRFASSRVASLLARLALFPHRDHPREELIDLLWPDSDLSAGRLNLRVALASLRRQLEPPDLPPGSVVAADRAVIRLRPAAFRCDVPAFEAAIKDTARAPSPAEKRAALDRAVALFSGELLPGFYDDWVTEERERLNALCEAARRQRDALPRTPSLPETSQSLLPFAAIPFASPAPLLNFPLQWTRFFGREAEVAEIVRRLAIEAARQAAGFSGPVCFASLADLSDAAAIPDAVAQALSLTRSAAEPVLDQLAAHLLPLPPALLVLDNFEHLVERGAPLLFSLLGRVPTLTCLATSRRLALPGEWEYPVPPLPLPPEGETADRAAGNPSVQLYEESRALWVTLQDDSGQLWTLANLGSIAYEEGDPDTSAALTALALCLKLQDKQALHALLAQAACLHAGRGDFQKAARLHGASEAVRRRIGAGLSAQDAADRDGQRAEVRAALGEADYAAQWGEGEALTEEQAVAEALR